MTENASHRRFAGFLAFATAVGAVALPVLAIIIWLFWDRFAGPASANLGLGLDLSVLGQGARAAILAISLTGALIWSSGLLSLRRTFTEAAAGRPLSENAVRGFRRFAWIALAMVFVGIVQRTLYVMIYSAALSGGGGQLSIQFGSREVGALFIGLLFVFAAHLFEAGRRAADENASFL
jgi:hypothetical protein